MFLITSTTTSLFCVKSGIVLAWTGVGLMKPMLDTAFRVQSEIGKSSQDAFEGLDGVGCVILSEAMLQKSNLQGFCCWSSAKVTLTRLLLSDIFWFLGDSPESSNFCAPVLIIPQNPGSRWWWLITFFLTLVFWGRLEPITAGRIIRTAVRTAKDRVGTG
jgi:hypothetical protein